MPLVDRAGIAAEIRAEMARQQKTQRDLGEVLGIDQGSASLRLSGRRSFRAEELAAIAEWLGRPIGQFMGERERIEESA